uniref:lysozyme n=1 Tax=Cacopsylla melanoneura TaxID=428564 RepID=A0A8D8X5F8_9HEMI
MSPLSLTILLTVLMTCTLLPHQIESKTFGACELAQYLAGKSEIKKQDIPPWVCIATVASNRNSDKISMPDINGISDHGIFQINQVYWCTASGPAGKGCNSTCAAFEDDDISDDVDCVAHIYALRKMDGHDGFSAWMSAYGDSCSSPEKVNAYLEKCYCP